MYLFSFPETEDLNLLVSKVSWSSASDKLDELSQEIVSVRVTNHTKCGCLCEVKPADCDNRTQVHSSENCRCECKAQGATCPINFQWNPEKCQCVCDPTNIQHMCTKRYQFDDKKCGCVCSSKSCKVKRKIRDPKDCRCKCPAKICLSEERYDLRTCTCVWRGERLRRTHRKRRLMWHFVSIDISCAGFEKSGPGWTLQLYNGAYYFLELLPWTRLGVSCVGGDFGRTNVFLSLCYSLKKMIDFLWYFKWIKRCTWSNCW